MKILHISASYKPAHIYGGTTVSVSKLCEQLIKNVTQVEVFTTTANGVEELPVIPNTPHLIDGVNVRYFKRITKDHSHFSPQLLLTLWKEVKSFDVVHIHAWWNLVSVLSCFITLIRKVPVIVSPRGTLSSYTFKNKHQFIKRILHLLIGRPLLNRCHIHVTSGHEQEAMSKILKPKGTFTIYNAVNFPVCLPKQTVKAPMLKLLFLSRIDPKKGLELLFAALSNIRIPYRLTIAGNGDQSYITLLKKLSVQYQIDTYLDWVGFKSKEKFELIAQHELLVLPSYDENFGNVVIESLSVGTAVLISSKVGLAKYVQENQLGWICDTTVLSIIECLNQIYSTPGQLHAIREIAPKIIANDFDEEKLIKQYIQMYQQAILANHG